jgi:hypothetical protein
MAVSRAGGAASCAEKYRALRRTVPDDVKTAELEDIEEWLGETVRQVDSSLLDEWEALSDPEAIERAAAAASASGDVVPPPRPITGNTRAFRVMVRNALFRRVQLLARDDFEALGALEAAAHEGAGRPAMDAAAWEDALGAYWDEYDAIDTGPAGRAPGLLAIDDAGRPVARPPDRRGPGGQPRLRHRRGGRPRRLRRRGRARHPHGVLRRRRLRPS